MTKQKAIKIIKDYVYMECDNIPFDVVVALELAIKCIKTSIQIDTLFTDIDKE